MKHSLENRASKAENLISESGSFKDWCANNLKEMFYEVDDLLTDAIATAEDMHDLVAVQEIERALSIIRKISV